MKPRNPFRNWTLESTIGLMFIIGSIMLAACVAAFVGVMVMAFTQPEPAQPRQDVSQYVDKRGDVKRLCLVFKTGDHVDAISCNVIDDINGELR